MTRQTLETYPPHAQFIAKKLHNRYKT